MGGVRTNKDGDVYGLQGLFAAGEAPAMGDLGPWAQVSAVAVLAGVCWRLFGTIDKLCDRWNEWEKIRHDDSDRLNATLAVLQSNCAAMKAIHTTHSEK